MSNEAPILFLINKFKVGGAERMFIREANELHRRGYCVLVASLLPETEHDSFIDDLEIPQHQRVQFTTNSLLHVRVYTSLLAYIKQNKVVTIYATLEHANVVARIVGLLRPSLRICIRESNVASVKPIKFKLLDVFLNARANVIIAISKGVRDSLVAYQPFYKRKITIIELAVEVPNKEIARVSRANEVLTILSVGRMTQQKRHDVLLRAFTQAKNEAIQEMRLVIVGDGSERQQLESLVQELGISDSVTFTGTLPYKEVLQWYERSDIFALASDWEGSSNVIREAMARCLPIVSTKIPVIREAVIDDKTGYLVALQDTNAFADALKRLVKNASLRRKFGRNGYQRVKEHFNFDNHIAMLLSYLCVG